MVPTASQAPRECGGIPRPHRAPAGFPDAVEIGRQGDGKTINADGLLVLVKKLEEGLGEQRHCRMFDGRSLLAFRAPYFRGVRPIALARHG